MPQLAGIDHIYIAVRDMARAEVFYDKLMLQVLGCRKNKFPIGGDPHIQYYNRHFGYVLRPARSAAAHNPYAAGLHHFCLRVETIEDVAECARMLQAVGIEASAPHLHSEYSPDYWATFFTDPDGLRLEITNYWQERRNRHDNWSSLVG